MHRDEASGVEVESVEVLLTEEGLAGSRYAGKVIEVAAKGGRALVEFEAFNEDEDEDALVREWHQTTHIQPVPPPTPDGYLQRLTAGDEVEALYDDGWWEMTYKGTRKSKEGSLTEYIVWSELYQVERQVAAHEIRPRWKRWGTKWRQLEQEMNKQSLQKKDKDGGLGS